VNDTEHGRRPFLSISYENRGSEQPQQEMVAHEIANHVKKSQHRGKRLRMIGINL